MTDRLILIIDICILLIATGICRYGYHRSFWALIIPVTLVIMFSFLVACELDNYMASNLMGWLGDWPVRSVVWRVILGVGLLLRLISGYFKMEERDFTRLQFK